MRHSTKSKYTGYLKILMENGTPILYGYETYRRFPKYHLVTGDKESTSKEAKGIQAALIRELRNINSLLELQPIESRTRYMVCKEYLSIDEVKYRLETNQDEYDYPFKHYIEGFGGWVFWIQEVPIEEALYILAQKEANDDYKTSAPCNAN